MAQVAWVAPQQLVTATAATAATVDYPTESVELAAQALAVLPEHPANRKVPDNEKFTRVKQFSRHSCYSIRCQ